MTYFSPALDPPLADLVEKQHWVLYPYDFSSKLTKRFLRGSSKRKIFTDDNDRTIWQTLTWGFGYTSSHYGDLSMFSNN